MKDYKADTYGEHIADVYDAWYPSPEPACIDFLAELGAKGRVLELGIGTGRIAVPLKVRGIDVHGIDASVAMVKQLRARAAGKSIPVDIGDFAHFSMTGSFNLIYVVFNTFFALTTQEAQSQCLKSAAKHLARDGCLVMEAFVPDIGRFVGGQTVRATKVETDRVQLDVSMHNPILQQVTSQHVAISEEGIRMYPVLIRYAWPSEIDMMARAAGLKLNERWQDWIRTPFSSASARHVSIYAINVQKESG